MPGRVIAIGDIHGCSAALETMLELIDPKPDDTIVTLGDYVDRGPNSKGVINRLIELKEQCNLVALFGNHEEMMFKVVIENEMPYDWLRYGGVDTLDSYGFGGDLQVVPDSHRQFLKDTVDYYETESHFFVHANYDASYPLSKQPADLLRWVKLSEFLPDPHFSGKKAVVGHTHQREGEIYQLPHLICLDTYCYGGKWLTAMDVQSGEIWQVHFDGQVRRSND